MEVLSPELVLIDEDLAAKARSALATPPDVFDALAHARARDTVRRLRVSFDAQEAEAAAAVEIRRRLPASRRWFAGAAILAAGALAATAAAVETLGQDEVTTARALASNAPATTHRHPQDPRPAVAPRPAPVTATAVRHQARPRAAAARPKEARAVHSVAARRLTVRTPRKAPGVRAKPAHAGATAAIPAKP